MAIISSGTSDSLGHDSSSSDISSDVIENEKWIKVFGTQETGTVTEFRRNNSKNTQVKAEEPVPAKSVHRMIVRRPRPTEG